MTRMQLEKALSTMNVYLITCWQGDGFIFCLKARPHYITISNEVNQHKIARWHHFQRIRGGPLTTLPMRDRWVVKQNGAQNMYDYRTRKKGVTSKHNYEAWAVMHLVNEVVWFLWMCTNSGTQIQLWLFLVRSTKTSMQQTSLKCFKKN